MRYQIAKMRTPKEGDAELVPPEPMKWQLAAKLAAGACAPLLAS